MWPAASFTVSTIFVSRVFTVTLPVHTPAVNAVVAVGEIASAPPEPAAESAGVPVKLAMVTLFTSFAVIVTLNATPLICAVGMDEIAK